MIKFKIFDVMSGFIMRSVELGNWMFTELNQGPGVLTGDLTADKRLRDITIPDQYGIVAIDGDRCVWAGIIRDRPWRRRQKIITIGCEDMSSIFYDLIVRPGQGDYLVTSTPKEQALIFKDQIDRALDDPALPTFAQDIIPNDGITREATFRIFSNVAENLNRLSQRENSLEWWVTCELDGTGRYVIPVVHVGYRGLLPYPIQARCRDQGGNVTDYDLPESSQNGRNREYATGDGQPPDVPWAIDEDPRLANGEILLREGSTSWAGVTVADTLFGHARDQRLFKSVLNTTATITVLSDRPDYKTYSVGDRVAVDIDDEWLTLSLPGALITGREISGGRGVAQVVRLTISTSDYCDTTLTYEAPEVPVEE